MGHDPKGRGSRAGAFEVGRKKRRYPICQGSRNLIMLQNMYEDNLALMVVSAARASSYLALNQCFLTF